MTQSSSLTKTLYCSFCSKNQHEVEKLIAQPPSYICSECVELCMDIIIEARTKRASQRVAERQLVILQEMLT